MKITGRKTFQVEERHKQGAKSLESGQQRWFSAREGVCSIQLVVYLESSKI